MSEKCPECGASFDKAVQERDGPTTYWKCWSYQRHNEQHCASTMCDMRSLENQVSALTSQLAAESKRADEAERERDEANAPFEAPDPRIEVYRNEGKQFYHCRIDGGDTAPFTTWREAYRYGEGVVDWRDEAAKVDELAKKLAAAEARATGLEDGIKDFINDYFSVNYHTIGPAEVARKLNALLAAGEEAKDG